MLLIGTHISAAGGVARAFSRADALGCEAMQIFTRNQLQWQSRPVLLEEARGFYDAWQKSGIKCVVSHASYLINIASSDAEVLEKSRRALRDETERCYQLGINDIVLHPGFAKDGAPENALKTVSESLRLLFEETPGCKVRILLETMAGQGSALGGDLSHFSVIGDMLHWNRRLAFCIDTCHAFAAGYDMRSPESYERFISLIDKHIGTDNVYCWHVNDCKSIKGSRLDRHAHLGEGQIGHQAFSLLMNDERFDGVPAILETPKDGIGDEGNLAFLRKVRGQ